MVCVSRLAGGERKGAAAAGRAAARAPTSVPELGRREIWGDMGRYGKIWGDMGGCSSSVPELGRRFPSINNFLPERQDTGERKAPLLRSLPSIVREVCRPTPRGPRRTQGNPPPPPSPLSQAVAKHTDVRNQESALLTRLAFCCVAYAVGAVGGAEAARVCCIGSEATADEAASSRCSMTAISTA